MKMLAVKHYRRLTGKNLAGGKDNLKDIMGDKEAGLEFSPDYFVAFLFAVLVDGAYPDKPDFTEDDVASWVNLYDKKLASELQALFWEEMTGKSADELLEIARKMQEEAKNQPAPESGADSPGMTLSDLRTVG